MRRSSGVSRVLTVVVSLLVHLALALGLLMAWVDQSPPPELAAVEVALVSSISLFPKPAPPAPAPAKAVLKPPRRTAVRPKPPAPIRSPLVMVQSPRVAIGPGMSDAALSGSMQADGDGAGGSGSGGGGECNMARRLQAALRKDPLVLAAASKLSGRAVLVWNGGWVQNEGEDGAGLSAVREAISWEVGFAPEACRSREMRGLVVFSFGHSPGMGRLVVGADHWKWSDMLKSPGRIDSDRPSRR